MPDGLGSVGGKISEDMGIPVLSMTNVEDILIRFVNDLKLQRDNKYLV